MLLIKVEFFDNRKKTFSSNLKRVESFKYCSDNWLADRKKSWKRKINGSEIHCLFFLFSTLSLKCYFFKNAEVHPTAFNFMHNIKESENWKNKSSFFLTWKERKIKLRSMLYRTSFIFQITTDSKYSWILKFSRIFLVYIQFFLFSFYEISTFNNNWKTNVVLTEDQVHK